MCYFGEGAGERRSRLKTLLAKVMLDTGRTPDLIGKSNPVEKERNEENEYYVYEG